jgi:hypothetical protein
MTEPQRSRWWLFSVLAFPHGLLLLAAPWCFVRFTINPESVRLGIVPWLIGAEEPSGWEIQPVGVIAAIAWLSRRLLALPALAASAEAGAPALPGARLMAYLPFGTVVVAAFVPLAAGLYLATTTAWTVAERTALRQFITG